jgi:site-specific DNA recombinase
MAWTWTPKGQSIPMDKLDRLVTERLADKLITPERLGKSLRSLLERQSSRDEDHAVGLTALRKKLADVEGRLGRLHDRFAGLIVARWFLPASL